MASARPIRLLVVEDNQQRIDLFSRWIPEEFSPVFVPGAGRAMRIIELDAGNVFAGIALDYDLDEQPVIPSERMLSGRNVAIKVAQLISCDVPILIHSMNVSGSQVMQNMLEASGFHVTRRPFRFLVKVSLGQWLETIREAKDES